MIDAIHATAIRTLFREAPHSTISALMISAYVVATAIPFSPWPSIVGWTICTLTSALTRDRLARAFARAAPPDEDLSRWMRRFDVQTFVIGVIRGAAAVLFVQPDEPLTAVLIVGGLFASASGSVSLYAYNPATLNAVVVPMFAIAVTRLCLVGTTSYIAIGIGSGLYGCMMILFCRQQARTIRESFEVKHQNDALIRELQLQKAEAERARKAAEQANLAKSQFLAAASHDLRQPLYALSLFSASLDTLRLDSDSHRVVAGISENIAAMEAMFAGLLDVSRLDAGVVEVAREPISIDSLFDRLSQVFRPHAVRQGLDLRFRSTDEWVNSDRTLLEQVLGNFLSNALRYTHRGGVLVAARTRGDTVRLEIWDTGIGISDADVGRIFDEYVQLGNPERERRNGLGLGLSIAQRSAELLGTAVGVRSRPGRGSCFSISQPASERQPIPSVSVATEAARTPRPGSDLPILVVDDDRDIRLALANLLTRWDVRHEIVASADAALARVADGHAFRLIIADYRLPGRTDGLSLLSELAQNHPAPKPPGVLITGDFDVQLIGAARDAGVALFHKPITPEVLRGIIGLPAAAPGGCALMDALPD